MRLQRFLAQGGIAARRKAELLITETGMLIRMHIAEISRIGRATQGVRLIRLGEESSTVTSVNLCSRDSRECDSHDEARIVRNRALHRCARMTIPRIAC